MKRSVKCHAGMKTMLLSVAGFSLVLACLTLGAGKESPKNYHLVQTQMLDGASDGKNPPTVYVLLFPDNTRPKVFQRFDSQPMEVWLSNLPRGSIVHYDANGFLARVPSAQLEALKACCQKKGVAFAESVVN